MDGNTWCIGGLVVKNIHISIASMSFFVLTGGVLSWFLNIYRSRGNRELDQYADSGNAITHPDNEGYRTLAIRHIGPVRLVESVITSERVRKKLLLAATKCDWVHRFIKDNDPADQEEILRALRNAFVGYFAEGEAAKLAELPTREIVFYIAPTGSDTEDASGIRMIRTVVATAKQLRIVTEHPADKWHFEGNQERMLVRLNTLRNMAEALKDGGYRHGTNGQRVRIVDTVVVQVRI